MFAVLFIILAAICKAFADTIAHHKGGSLPKLLPKYAKYFDMQIQGEFLPFTKYPLDGWHVANSGMIGFFLLAVGGIYIVLGSIGFILAFNLFYNKILK
ncbi:MAG: hypothetical protein ACEQSR_03775 [Candidatus Methylacidiphilales bacterium]